MTQITRIRHVAWILGLMLAATLTVTGCDQHDHPHGEAHDELAPVAITHFSDQTELFVEFEPLIVGKQSKFAAHLTRLSDFKAVDAGKLTVTLSGGNQPEETFAVDAPAQAGIFKPLATPRHAGTRHMVFQLTSPSMSVVHDVGNVMVYTDMSSATKAAAAEPEEPGGIAYLKEQQWKTDYGLTQVNKRILRSSIAATGILRAPPDRDAQLTAAADGQVIAADTFPRVGMPVNKGQILAYLVPRLGGDIDIATLDAAVQKARITAQQATRERERLEALFKQEAIPEKRLTAAVADEGLARAELAAAERRAAPYRGSTAGGIALRAPIAGTVADIHVTPGGVISAGQPILRIANTDRLWLEARVAETDLGKIGEPSGASFTAVGFDQAFEVNTQDKGARLVGFGKVIDPATRTAPLVFEFDNPNQRLPIGLAVRANVYASQTKEVLAVPATAVIDDNGQPVVYVQRSGESFERRPVSLGRRDGDWIEVKNGVAASERVVSKGAYQVRLAATAPAAMGEGHVH